MFALLRFFLALFSSLFKSKSRLEAENASQLARDSRRPLRGLDTFAPFSLIQIKEPHSATCSTKSYPGDGSSPEPTLRPPLVGGLSLCKPLSKKKGTGTMAGPPTRSSLSLAFRNNWRWRGFALAVWIASVLRIARSDAEENQRRCSQ